MLVGITKGTKMLLMVTHLFLSTPLIMTAQPLLPLTLELPSQSLAPPSIFQCYCLCPQYFSSSFCTQVRPVIGFLIVFPEDVLDVLINL